MDAVTQLAPTVGVVAACDFLAVARASFYRQRPVLGSSASLPPSERPVPADRWSSYAIIAAVGWLGFGYRVVDLATIRAFSFDEPADVITRIPGLWLAGIGLVILARATYEMLHEPRLR